MRVMRKARGRNMASLNRAARLHWFLNMKYDPRGGQYNRPHHIAMAIGMLKDLGCGD